MLNGNIILNRSIFEEIRLVLEVYSFDDIKQAEECLNKWIKQARSSCLKPFVELSYKFKEKMIVSELVSQEN